MDGDPKKPLPEEGLTTDSAKGGVPSAAFEPTQMVNMPEEQTIKAYLAGQGIPTESDPNAPTGDTLSVEGGVKYKVGPILAKGGMGVVSEATDLNCQRVVAMKRLPQDTPPPKEELARFVGEAQITSQLEHPNIVPVHELGLDINRNIFYTMKYVKGITLTDVLLGIRRNNQEIIDQYPLTRLLNIFQKVCDAVAFAHSRDVVHCDLKPDNIMICDFGEVVVMDWGLAKVMDASAPGSPAVPPHPGARSPSPLTKPTESNLPPDGNGHGESPKVKTSPGLSAQTGRITTATRTTAGKIMGTPGFMSPEQARGAYNEIDLRSDIYSLGATLYSILTLRAPLVGKDTKELLRRILDGDILSPAAFNHPELLDKKVAGVLPTRFAHCPEGKIPTSLSDIAMKALSVNPADRFATVQELQQEIESYQNGTIWNLVIDEDFTQPGFASRWEVIGGQYELKPGELKITGGDPQILLLKKDVPGDVRIEFECSQDSVYLNDISCFMSSIHSDNHREIPSSGYEFKIGGYDNSQNLLLRADQKMAGQLASPLTRGKTFKVRAERAGSKIRLSVNNEEIFRITDRDPLSGPDRGAVGVHGWMAETRYSRIRIYQLGTPWKSDILDFAERQMQKGNYSIAMALFQEILDSFPDTGRLERARHGYEAACRRDNMTKNMAVWKEQLQRAWPQAKVQLRMDNDGLTLEITHCDIEDLSPIAGMPLTSFYCALNRITSLEPLRGMPLSILSCNGNPISSLEPLRGMPLKTLVCEFCHVRNLEPLRGMPLTMLVCNGNEIESLEPLTGMSLNLLGCYGNRIESLEPLRGMPLNALYCNANRITSLEPLQGLPLVTLNCSGNRIENLEPLKDLSLTVLHTGDNLIQSLEPLAAMHLNMLSCHANKIKSLKPLENMQLAALTCGANEINSVSAFIKKPPDDFRFDCDTIPTHELEWVHQTWARDFRFSTHARNAEVLLALRKNDIHKLRELAAPFKDHRYLFIPKFLRWDEAKKFCEDLGGHLLTVSSREENDFVSSLFKTGCWFWLGLKTTDQQHAWVTGEPVAYRNFVDLLQEWKPGPKIFSGKWMRDDVLDAHNSFMIEWES